METKQDIQKLEAITKIKDFGYINIVAKRWFQRSYGNTYHSCLVSIVSGKGMNWKKETIGYTPFTYGYGSHYLNTAARFLDVSESSLREFIKNNPEHILESVIDVNRKKDL